MASTPNTTAVILAAVELGADGDEAIRHADRHARAQASRLVVMRVIDDPDARAPEAELVEQVRAITGRREADFDVLVRDGGLSDSVLGEAEARSAVLIVTHVSGADPRSIDDVQRIARDARVSVLVVRAPRGLRVLAATDLSASSSSSSSVLAAAAIEAKQRGVPVTALHCIVHHGIEGTPSPLPPDLAELIAHARRELVTATRTAGLDAEIAVVVGAPAPAIIRAIDGVGASLVVVAAHGASVLGSVADAVLREARCSVLVVRGS